MTPRRIEGIGFWEVVALGVGGMVGGGIFAVLGLAVQLAHGGTPVAFAIAGGVALVTAYSYARLSVTFPSQGGTVTFVDRAFGVDVLTGSLNILLWLSYMVMLALYSSAFGSYAAALLGPENSGFWKHGFTSVSIVAITALNLFGARTIGRAENWIVALKITILLLFVVIGIRGIQLERVAPDNWVSPASLIAGGMIIFVAYEGFELIANTAQDVRNPAKTLPRAYFTAVCFVAILYVLVAVVTVGNLSEEAIVAAKDYALAEAARPFMGPAGFTLIAVAALLSTASAINATLYGAARMTYIIAKDGELPEVLEEKVWNEPLDGLLITAGVTLVLANALDLSSISTTGSAGFLLVFAAVNAANAKLFRETASRRWISATGAAACAAALGTLLWHTAHTMPGQLWILGGLLMLAFAIEAGYRLLRHKRPFRLFHQSR